MVVVLPPPTQIAAIDANVTSPLIRNKRGGFRAGRAQQEFRNTTCTILVSSGWDDGDSDVVVGRRKVVIKFIIVLRMY